MTAQTKIKQPEKKIIIPQYKIDQQRGRDAMKYRRKIDCEAFICKTPGMPLIKTPRGEYRHKECM
jgi:hypothetical protein